MRINSKVIKRISLHLLYWIVFTFAYSLFATIFFDRGFDIRRFPHHLTALVYGHYYLIPACYFIAYFLIPKLLQKKRILLFILSFVSILILLAVIDDLSNIYTFLPKHNPSMLEPFKEYMAFKPMHLFVVSVLLFAQVLLFLVVKFVKKYAEQHFEREKLKAQLAETELNVLKNQINPHFLFNVLNNLYSLAIENEDQLTADGISRLSGLMRYNIYTNKNNKVPLEEEIDYIQNYISLQKTRFVGEYSLHVNFEVNGCINSKVIAPFILIMFIENAFKYGIGINKKSNINIHLEVLDGYLEFNICNYKIKTSNGMDSGIGLGNARQRLEYFYPSRHELVITETENEFKVRLKILDKN